MTGALAAHYARALADAVFGARSGLPAEEATRQLAEATDLISGSKELERALLSPAVNRAKKASILNKLADQAGFHRLIRNFLLVLVNHRRTKELRGIRDQFEAEVDLRTGWVPADIASAQPLTDEQKQAVEKALGTRLGRYVRARYTVDESLLAGVRARVAAVEYDATLRGKLEGMRQRLRAAR